MRKARPGPSIVATSIMAVICPSCNKSYKNTQGLTQHRRKCLMVLPTTIALLKKRKRAVACGRQKEASGSGSGVSGNHDAEHSRDVHMLFLSMY